MKKTKQSGSVVMDVRCMHRTLFNDGVATTYQEVGRKIELTWIQACRTAYAGMPVPSASTSGRAYCEIHFLAKGIRVGDYVQIGNSRFHVVASSFGKCVAVNYCDYYSSAMFKPGNDDAVVRAIFGEKWRAQFGRVNVEIR